MWLDGKAYFASGDGALKGRNLARDARCALAVSSLTPPAADLVVEGDAARVTDGVILRRVAAAYASGEQGPFNPTRWRFQSAAAPFDASRAPEPS